MVGHEGNNKETKRNCTLPKAIRTKQRITRKERKIAKEVSEYFTSAGTALTRKIPIPTKDVSEYLPQCNALMEHKELSFQKFVKSVQDDQTKHS